MHPIDTTSTEYSGEHTPSAIPIGHSGELAPIESTHSNKQTPTNIESIKIPSSGEYIQSSGEDIQSSNENYCNSEEINNTKDADICPLTKQIQRRYKRNSKKNLRKNKITGIRTPLRKLGSKDKVSIHLE